MRAVLLALSAGLFSIAIASASLAAPQPAPNAPQVSPRPKVALVLSGGGALGIAHVGVIRELERMGIRPDLVVGTSMGAIVGGLYAAGYTGDELEEVVASIDWPKLFDDTPPRNGLSYRQKHDQANFPTKWRLRVKDGRLALPTGAISDQNLVLKLRELLSAKTTVADFDLLHIPFRCVATDLENGKPVVLKSGDLAAAIRASFSLPGVLPPMQYEDRLLVDGGMAMNIPVEVAREMGADILIVVKLSNKLKTQAEIQSAVDVVAQSISLLILQNEQTQIAKMRAGDVLVDVDLAKYTSTSFDRSRDLIEPGRVAVVAAKERLRDLPHSGPPVSVAPPKIVVDFIRIKNDTPLDDGVITARLSIKPGEALDRDQLNKDLSEIFALGSFERVDYSIVQENGRSGLEVRTVGRKGGFDYLRPSASLETNFDGEAGYRVSFDYTATALTPNGAEWRVEGVIGDRVRLYSEYFQPLDPEQRWFVMPRVGGQGFDISVYDEDGLKTSKFRTYFAGASLEAGRQFGDWGEVRAGIERGAGYAELKEGFAPVSDVDIEIGRVFVSGGLDTLDEPYFAHHGTRANIRWTQALEGLGSAQDYQTIDANVVQALSWDDSTLILTAGGGSTLSGHLPLDGLFHLGGPFNLSGYKRDELTGEAYARAGAMLFTRLNDAEPLLLGLPIYAGASLEMGNVWADPDDAAPGDLLLGGSLFVGADTILGPAFIGYGHTEHDRQTLFFFFGRPF